MDIEALLTLGAVTVELGVPFVAVVLLLRRSPWSKRAVVVLGAVVPLLALYFLVSISYALQPENQSNVFSFFAVWVMSFILFVVLALGGLIVAFIPKPTNSLARFGVGVASAPVSYGLLILVAQVW